MKKFVLLLLGFILGALAMYFYCCVEIQKNVIEKPTGLITPAQAKVLDANWTATRKRAVDSAAGRPDNRSAWWSLKDIQNYLAYAKNQAVSLSYEMDGVRVYLGVYPSNALDGKADYTTMFMVPTGKKLHAETNFNLLNLLSFAPGSDIPGADGFNESTPGNPPGANYPQ